MRAVILVLALALAGCTAGGEEAEANATLADIENVSGLDAISNNPPPAPAPGLEPLTRTDIENELEPGAGCDFSRNGQLLLVATASDAIVRTGGRIVHLRPEGTLEPSGAFFASDTVRISIGRTSEEGARSDETTTWPARAAVSSPESAEPNEYQGSWSCGA